MTQPGTANVQTGTDNTWLSVFSGYQYMVISNQYFLPYNSLILMPIGAGSMRAIKGV